MDGRARIGETYRPLREVVAEEIRSMIMRGDLAAGERLHEEKLAEQLGVSRNPIREAIRLLEATGLVEVIHRRGTYVCTPDPDDTRHVLEVRSVLESYAAASVAAAQPDGVVDELRSIVAEGMKASSAGNTVRASELHSEFHKAVERATGNPYLVQVVEPLRQRTEMIFSILVEARGSMGWHEHEAIIDAIARGDADGARSTVSEHILSVLENLEAAAPPGGQAT
jgi:DNA-binding GntR family transcriptional regulator